MNNSITNESIWGKLSDMDKKLGKIQEQQIASQSSNKMQVSESPIIDIKNLEYLMAEKLEQMELALSKPITQKNEHRISVDIKSSWVSFVLVGLFLSLIVAGAYIYKQREINGTLTDNNWKYRYIKAFNRTDTVSILHLETIFTYERDEKAISKLIQLVTDIERKTRKRAEELEQAKLKEEEAERLTKEIEELKSK